MNCPKCGSSNIVTDRDSDPPHTCTECWRAFDDSDIPVATAPEEAEGVEEQIGEILGWRAWYIIETPQGIRLQSLGTGGVSNGQHVWEPGSIEVASCSLGREHISPSSVEAVIYGSKSVPFDLQVPVEGCSCGFYAASSREHLIELNSYHLYDVDYDLPKCIGQVAMSGKVIPGSQGWKSQEMWPHKLFVPFEFWRYVKPLESTYNCTVELSRTLEKQTWLR